MSKALRFTMWPAAVFLISGCASIVSGGDQSVAVSSDPSGASVKVHDSAAMIVYESSTPATVMLKKRREYVQESNYRVVIAKQVLSSGRCCSPAARMRAGTWWLIVDPMRGAMWTLAPDMVGLTLSSGVSARAESTPIRVVLLQDVSDELRKRLKPIQTPAG